MRFLFTSTVGLGHLLPLLPLALAARAAGHEVTVATAQRNAERLIGLGLQHREIEETTEQDWRAVQRPDDPEAGPTAVFGRLNPLAALPAMQSIVEEWRPDVLFSEGAEFAGGLVADLHQIPIIRVHPGMSGDGLWEALVASSLSQIRTELGLPADLPTPAGCLTCPRSVTFRRASSVPPSAAHGSSGSGPTFPRAGRLKGNRVFTSLTAPRLSACRSSQPWPAMPSPQYTKPAFGQFWPSVMPTSASSQIWATPESSVG